MKRSHVSAPAHKAQPQAIPRQLALHHLHLHTTNLQFRITGRHFVIIKRTELPAAAAFFALVNKKKTASPEILFISSKDKDNDGRRQPQLSPPAHRPFRFGSIRDKRVCQSFHQRHSSCSRTHSGGTNSPLRTSFSGTEEILPSKN